MKIWLPILKKWTNKKQLCWNTLDSKETLSLNIPGERLMTATLWQQNREGETIVARKTKKYPLPGKVLRFYGYTPTPPVYQSNLICKWNQSHNSSIPTGLITASAATGGAGGGLGAYFQKFKEVHRLTSFWRLWLLESCQRVHGWTGCLVRVCQVGNEIAVRRWRLNSLFNAWRVGRGATEE